MTKMFTSENYRGQGILTVLLTKLVDLSKGNWEI
ncbi:hypothetical protein [Peribacillus sp. NPDC058075]